MICYEEYGSPKEKQAAKKGAKRGHPTGKAKGYLLADLDDISPDGTIGAVSSIFDLWAGYGVIGLAYISVSRDYLRKNCRRVGRNYIPEDWNAAFDNFNQY